MRGAAPAGPDGTQQLRDQLAAAIAATSDAYRHTSRLIRVLTVLGQPSSPEDLVEQTLIVLSQVFAADVAAMTRVLDDRLLVTSSCGLAETDDAYHVGWPLAGGAAEALRRAAAVTAAGPDLTAADVPPSLADVAFGSAVWVPLSDGPDGRDELILLLRRTDEPFTPTELQVLGSVAARLRVAVEVRERNVAVERVAQAGARLGRHLDLPGLFLAASRLLLELLDADASLVVSLDGDRSRQQARSGQAVPDAPAQSAADLPGWTEARAGEAYRAVMDGCPLLGLASGRHAVLGLPVLRDGAPVALLYVARDHRRPFPRSSAEIGAIFASYVGAAMTNAELYHALHDSEASLRLITDSVSDLIAVVDAGGRFVYASPSHAREIAHEPAALLGTAIRDWVHPDDVERVRGALAGAARTPKVEYRLRTGAGGWVWIESALRPAPSADNTVVVSSRVINDRKRLEHELWQQATHDPLTGLANRALATDRLETTLATTGPGAPGQVGLLFCDLDRFKQVNDRLGHEAGDELLRLVAERLRSCVRPTDLLARFGGDEFVVVLDGIDELASVQRLGARMIRSLEVPFSIFGERVEISASIGGVLGVRGVTTASTMLRDADAAMYAAKGRGSGLVQVFDEAASHHSLDRLQVGSELTQALDRGQFSMHYQPICHLRSGRLLGFEALLRWHHPQRGLIPADTFIPLAEDTGAITTIGRWALEEACRQLAAWQRLPGRRHLEMSINVSAAQLQQPDFATHVLDTLHRNRIDPGDVWLEITEHSSIHSDVTQHAQTLRAAGLRFALDDFGIAYSNLSHLNRLPIEALKIDRSFVAGLSDAEDDQRLVRAILAIADSLDLGVVAEGIETAQQRALLLAMGEPLGQGFLLSPPLDVPAATALLHGSARPGALAGTRAAA